MKNLRLSDIAANAAVEAVGKLLDGGWIDIYEGTQPATANSPLPTGTKLLASVQFANPAFQAPEGGRATSAPLLPDHDAAQTGRPQWYRLYRADHATPVQDGDIASAAPSVMRLRALLIAQHSQVFVDSFVLVMPKEARS